jgi:hypothetical protein
MKPQIRAPLFAVLLAGALAASGQGQVRPVPLGTSPAYEFFSGSGQDVAALPDGRFATVWTQAQLSQGNADVYLQLVGADGTLLFGPPGQPVAASSAVEGDAVVAAHAQEGVLVAWRRFGSAQQDDSQVLVQWLDGQGRPRWGAGVVAAPAIRHEHHGAPFLLASADGGAFACFLRAKQVGSTIQSNVYCQRFGPDGRPLWGKNGARASAVNQRAEPPQMVPDGAGGVLVLWRDVGILHTRDENGGYRGQRLGPSGRPLWGAEGRIIYQTRSHGSFFLSSATTTVVPDGSGGAVVAFDDGSGATDISDRDVIVQRVSNSGEGLWGPGVTVGSGPDLRYVASLTAGPDGGAFVGVSSLGRGLTFHRLDGDGQALWPVDGVPVTDSPILNLIDFPSSTVGVFDGSVLRFVWQQYALLTDGSDIRFGALDLAGKRLSEGTGAPLSDLREDPVIAGFAFDPGSGASFVIWTDYTDLSETEADVLGAVYTAPR